MADPARWSMVVIDDNDDYALLLRLWFERHPQFSVIGTCSTAVDALALVSRRQPDLVVVDEAMNSSTDPSLISRLRDVSADSTIISICALPSIVRFDPRHTADAVVSKVHASLADLVDIAVALLERV